jgi:hypothetical protein
LEEKFRKKAESLQQKGKGRSYDRKKKEFLDDMEVRME